MTEKMQEFKVGDHVLCHGVKEATVTVWDETESKERVGGWDGHNETVKSINCRVRLHGDMNDREVRPESLQPIKPDPEEPTSEEWKNRALEAESLAFWIGAEWRKLRRAQEVAPTRDYRQEDLDASLEKRLVSVEGKRADG